MKLRISLLLMFIMIIFPQILKANSMTPEPMQSRTLSTNPGTELITISVQELDEKIKQVQEETVKAVVEEKDPQIAYWKEKADQEEKAVQRERASKERWRFTAAAGTIAAFILGLLIH